MSCFVVDKGEYAKAAGFVAATVQLFDLYLWDDARGRLTREDIYHDFCDIYCLNVHSVAESWDEEIEADDADYTAEFLRAVAKTNSVIYSARKDSVAKVAFYKLLSGFHNFCQSVLYQIENKEDGMQAKVYFDHVNAVLAEAEDKLLVGDSDTLNSWGSFDMDGLIAG